MSALFFACPAARVSHSDGVGICPRPEFRLKRAQIHSQRNLGTENHAGAANAAATRGLSELAQAGSGARQR